MLEHRHLSDHWCGCVGSFPSAHTCAEMPPHPGGMGDATPWLCWEKVPPPRSRVWGLNWKLQ